MESIIRNKILEKIRTVFDEVAIEGHLQGSMARGNTDQYSDIDIWLTFRDENFVAIKESRFEYYRKVGEIVHICEPPQNRPIGGIFSSVIYKIETRLLVVDYVLCPFSTSFRTDDYKYLFGNIELPVGQFKYNPEKVLVSETYRLDFMISIINGSIKKLLRGEGNALKLLIGEYNNLKNQYGIIVEDLMTVDDTFTTLGDVIQKVKKISTKKQQDALIEIEKSINSFQSIREN